MWWCKYCGNGDGWGNHKKRCRLYRAPKLESVPPIRALSNLFCKLVAVDEVRKTQPWHPMLPEVIDWNNRIKGV